MISIIICSRSLEALSLVSESIEKTISTQYQIISIDNSQKKYGICEAYNIGAAQADYDLLCFMHEDINFCDSGWGLKVSSILNNTEVGVLGVAGGNYQPKAPSGWFGAALRMGINVIHTQNNKTQHDYFNPHNEKMMKAVALDGLWLCCRKSVWKEFKFDSKNFPGFHFYDIDFCSRVASSYTNYITFEVLIEHFSHGTFDKVWMENAINFYKIRKNSLPITFAEMTRTEKHYLDLVAMQSFTFRIIQSNMPKKDILYCLIECLKIEPLNRDNLYLLKRYIRM